MRQPSLRLGSLAILLLLAFLSRLDVIILQWPINRERGVGVLGSAVVLKQAGSSRNQNAVPLVKTPRFVQRRFGCLYLNNQSEPSSVCGCHVERQEVAATATTGFLSPGDAQAQADTPPPLLIPPNATFSTVNRTELLRGMGLSVDWEHSQGVLSVWHCRPSARPALKRIDARGWTFRILAQNDRVQMPLHTYPASDADDFSFQLSFPDGTPNGVYNITAILLHVDHQGSQDPPCFQNLTVRSHCKGETLWLDNFSQHVTFENVLYSHVVSRHQQPPRGQGQQQRLGKAAATESSKPQCMSLDQLTPGYFCKTADGDRIWTPAYCNWNVTTSRQASSSSPPPVANSSSATAAPATTPRTQTTAPTPTPIPQERVLLVGDSTFRYLASAASHVADYRKALTPHDFQKSLRAGVYDPTRWQPPRNHDFTRTLILGMGLHSTCYSNNLQEDLNMLPDLIRALVDQWMSFSSSSSSAAELYYDRKVVIRSTTATALMEGLDYNAKKCLYYTDTRLRVWNNKLREIASELNVTFWDAYSIVASVGPSPGEWAATDGTHYCHPDPDSSFCRQLVSMVRLAMATK